MGRRLKAGAVDHEGLTEWGGSIMVYRFGGSAARMSERVNQERPC